MYLSSPDRDDYEYDADADDDTAVCLTCDGEYCKHCDGCQCPNNACTCYEEG